MNRLAALLSMPFLAGCVVGAGNDYAQYYQALRQSIAGSFGTTRITRAQVENVPYASLSYRSRGIPEQMLILATDANGNQLWTAGSRVVLETRNGRVIRSVGLPHDIANRTAAGATPLEPPSAAISHPYTSTMVEDFPDIGSYGVRIVCTTRAKEMQTIIILGQSHQTYRIDEECAAKTLQWSFTDSYWVDAKTGIVWRSVQNLHPKGTPMGIQVLRPPV